MKTIFDFQVHDWSPHNQVCRRCGTTYQKAATTYAGYRCAMTLAGLPVAASGLGGTACECGGAKAGAKSYAAGHSDWCPVAPK